jgi:hypothetical protein
VRHTQHIAKSAASSITGLFALLSHAFRSQGSSPPSFCSTSVKRPLALAFTLVLASLAFTTAPAFAELGHGFAGLSFGSKGTAAGKLEAPAGVAVNDTTIGTNAEDVYVADRGNNRIDEFDSDGTFIRAWGWGVLNGKAELQQCTTACQAGIAGEGAGQLDSPEGIAVDNSGDVLDPSVEDVYVTNAADRVVEKFSATGKYEGQLMGVCEKAGESPPACAGFTPFRILNGVAVDLEGNVWVSGNVSGGAALIAEFGDRGTFIKNISAELRGIGNSLSLAVDSSASVYLGSDFGGVSKFASTTGEEMLEFGANVSGLAVDPTENDVYVGHGSSITRYGPFGEPYATPVEEFTSKQLTDGGGSGLAIDPASGTVYVADSTGDVVDALTEGEKPEVPLTETPESIEATPREKLKGELNPNATGATGALEYQFDYNAGASCTGTGGQSIPVPAGEVAEASKKMVEATAEHLQPSGKYTYCLVAIGTYGSPVQGNEVTFATAAAIEPEEPTGLEANPIAVTTATLKGVLNPNSNGEPGTYEFLYRESAKFCNGGGGSKIKGTATGASPEPVEADLTGLLPNTTYTFCLLARNQVNVLAVSEPVTFTTLAEAPTILGESVAALETTEATFKAEIVPEGAATTYHFEYLTNARFEANGETFTGAEITPESAIGADDTTHAAEARVTTLLPGTIYRYRVVAQNEVGGKTETVPGPGKTFTTAEALTTTAETCPNAQRRVEQPFGLTLPDCRAYEMVSPLQAHGQDATEPFVQSVPRASVSGEAITYASRGSLGDPEGADVENQTLSRRGPGGWSTRSVVPLRDPQKTDLTIPYQQGLFTPELTEGVVEDEASLPGTPSVGLEDRLYIADFATKSYEYAGGSLGDWSPLGASTDFTRVVYGEFGQTLEWFDGREIRVGVANDGEVMDSTVGSPRVNDFEGGAAGHKVWRAVSANASRIYFSSPGETELTEQGPPATPSLYLRENAEQPQSPMRGEECTVSTDACTIDVSASQRGVPDPHGPQTAVYWAASADGSKVFFTSAAELTDDAYTGPEDNAANLYEYEPSGVPGEPGRLTDLTVDDAGDGAAVQGVVQVSEDGSYVYFVAEGKLAEGAVAGAPNLYVSRDGEAPTLIATLGATDVRDWLGESESGGENLGEEQDVGGPAVNTAVVTPNGTRLAFLSYRELTGYDNRDANTGAPDDEIYLYDAETGGLVCASCNPSGERPIGSSSLNSERYDGRTQYRQRNLAEDGTLFFDSFDALVPHASDGRQNVYEYENGHVYPISDVAGGSESFFIDASPSGENVFFGSADQLLPQDTSNNIVVWDARVGGGFPVTVAAPACTTAEACRTASPPTPALFGTPPSATFSGPGNFPPPPPPPPPAVVKPKSKTVKCKKGHVKNKHGRCVSRPRKKKTKAKKSAKGRA